jgi:transposase InsO family protein
MIPQRPSKNPNLSAKPDVKQPLQILALTMIDLSTHLLELIVVSDKESRTVARAFDRSWLCRYPRPLICLHDKGTKFTGIEFQELHQSYGIKGVIATTANPQTNAILKCTHQVIANQLRSLCLMSIKLNSLADIQHELLAPVQWAMNSTYHTTLQATSAQLAFHRNMIMPTSYMAHWQSIRQRCQAITDRDNLHKNARRVPHMYSVGDLILIRQDTRGKNSPNPLVDPTD